MKILCVFGKYQYGKKERGLSTEYFSFVPAFEALEYEICFFDSWDRTLYKNFIELNQALINTVADFEPDVVFSVQLGYEIWTETWDFIRANYKCKTLNWCTDDSWKFKQHSKFLAPHFDLMVTTYEEFLPLYAQIRTNALLSTWALPVQWSTPPKEARFCKYNVSFVGAAHGDRKEKIAYLRSQNIDVTCFGYGWENGAIYAQEIPKIFNDSVISLNFANSQGENQIKARVFEVTGSGGFLLTENAKNLNKIFTDEEVIVFGTIQECAKKIKYYLENLNERDAIALHGFKKTSSDYTYAHKVKEIIAALDGIEKQSPSSVDLQHAIEQHKKNLFLQLIKNLLILIGTPIFGKEKGKRFARRAVYEICWRFCKEHTYSSKGFVGRMFYSE